MQKTLMLVCSLMLGLSSCGEVEEGPQAEDAAKKQISLYRVLRGNDFVSLTGCASTTSYEGAMRTALDYLVFDEGGDRLELVYVQRETRPLFMDLANRGDGEPVDPACLPASLLHIGKEIGMLVDVTSPEDGSEMAVFYDPTSTDFPDDEGLTYQVLSRMDYIRATGCKVSPSTYDKFHQAFDNFLFYRGRPDVAPMHMIAFLTDLRDSKPTPEETLNPVCLTPGLRQLAEEMGVLSKEGRILPIS